MIHSNDGGFDDRLWLKTLRTDGISDEQVHCLLILLREPENMNTDRKSKQFKIRF